MNLEEIVTYLRINGGSYILQQLGTPHTDVLSDTISLKSKEHKIIQGISSEVLLELLRNSMIKLSLYNNIDKSRIYLLR